MQATVETAAIDPKKLWESLQHIKDSFKRLAANWDSFSRVSNGSDFLLIQELSRQFAVLLRNTRSVENREAAINRLPRKVLALIFRNLWSTVDMFDHQWKSWPVVTRVCRLWRRVALQTPELWTLVRIPWKESSIPKAQLFLSLCFERSAALPISVLDHDGEAQLEPSFLLALEDNISRVEYLSLRRLPPRLPDLLTSKASQLKILDVRLSQPQVFASASWQSTSLRTIAMSNCSLWETLDSHTLVHLVITQRTFNLAAVEALFRLLLSCTTLQDLVIVETDSKSDVTLDQLRQLAQTQTGIVMPCLKRLQLAGGMLLISLIYLSLVLRATKWIKYLKLNRTIPTALCLPDSGNILGDLPPFQILKAQKVHLAKFGLIISSDDRHVVQLSHLSTAEQLNQFICTAEVQELQVSYESDLEADVLLKGMYNLRTLALLHSRYCNVLAWLLLIIELDLLPQLEELQVAIYGHQDGRVLLSFLRQRFRAGKQIRTLHLIRRAQWEVEARECFDCWYRCSWKWTEVVDRLFFDEVEEYPQLELPQIPASCPVLDPNIHKYPDA